VLSRDESGRRKTDQPLTENALSPADDAASIADFAAAYLAIVACALALLAPVTGRKRRPN
jgi:hypothetical protein